MTAVAPAQQNTTTFRNDSISGPIAAQSPSVPGFRHFSNVGDGQDFKGRMSSIDGSQSSAATPGAPPGKVPIPPLVRNDSTADAGPARKTWEVKPRPKPGRKPMSDDNSSKRKQQNRHAQRAFRDRRAQKVYDLEVQVAQMKETHDEKENVWKEHMRQNELQALEMRNHIRHLEETVARLQAQNSQLQSTIDSTKNLVQTSVSQPQIMTSGPNSVHSVLTPPSDPADDNMEIDFTHMFSSRKQPTFTSIASPIGTDDHCGFCTEDANCVCRQQEELNKSLPPIDPARATHSGPRPNDVSTPTYLEAPTTASGPGTCDMCLADPEKARQCRELAQSTQFTPINTVPISRGNKMNIDSSSNHNDRTSCSDFFSLARQRNVHLGPENYSRIAHIYPYHRDSARQGHSPAMEMDANDAAHALAALSRQDTRGSISSVVDRQS